MSIDLFYNRKNDGETMYKRIAISGPESSGKTSLAQALAARFGTVWTDEYARAYLEEKGGTYGFGDLAEIARGQLQRQDEDALLAQGFHFCDTDLVALKVWSDYRFGRTDPFILEELQKNRYDLTLLCRPDIPWEADPLRENPHDRDILFLLFKKELESLQVPFVEISGTGEDRLEIAARALEGFRV